jgi:hypothetical protein
VIWQFPEVAQASLEKLEDNVTEVAAPVTMLEGAAVNDVIVGAATAVTVSVAVAVTPAASVTTRASVGDTGREEVLIVTVALVAASEVKVTGDVPPVIWQLLAVAQWVPLSEKLTGTFVVLPAAVTVVAGVVKLLITGAAATLAAAVTTVPAELVTVSVYVVVALGVGLAVWLWLPLAE